MGASLQAEETQRRRDFDILSDDKAVCLLLVKGNGLSAKAHDVLKSFVEAGIPRSDDFNSGDNEGVYKSRGYLMHI